MRPLKRSLLKELTLSTELALLVEACGPVEAFCVAVDGQDSEIDWHRFEQLAGYHKLGAVAYDRLSKCGSVTVPGQVMEALSEACQAAAVRVMAHEAETLEIVDVLARSGLRSLILKGVAAGHLLYPGEHNLRFSSDIDILVAPGDLAAAEDVLRAAGFVPGQAELDMPHGKRSALLSMVHALNYQGPMLGSAFDVHHRVSHNPYWLQLGFDELYAQSEEVVLDGGRIRTLGPAHTACYMCCHMMDHALFMLRWVEDAARALDRAARMQPGFDVTAVEGLGARPAVEVAVQLVSLMSGRTFEGADAATAPQLSRLISSLETPKRLDDNRTLTGLLKEIRMLSRRADWGGSWSSLWYDVLMFLADPRDVVRLGLGRAWLPAYALMGPVFAAGRYLERRIDG